MQMPEYINKYKIERPIGQGAMGIVYSALDQDIDRKVAIKILHTHLIQQQESADMLQRFNHEIKAAARCFHPNIVTVFDCGFHDDIPYMVMEYVQGIDLRTLLKTGRKIEVDQAINIVLKILSALQFAHDSGVIHRDIKPANIMLLENGQVKVTDFGVAHLDSSELTQLGDVMGTLSYMAPEARAGRLLNGRSDIYSVAVLFFELLTHYRPLLNAVDEVMIREKLAELNLADNIYRTLIDVLIRGLADQEQRFSSAQEFAKALSTCKIDTQTYIHFEDDLSETVISISNQLNSEQLKPKVTQDTIAASAVSLLSHTHADELSLIEKSLSLYLGPVAKIMVKKYSKSSINLDQLLDSLVLKIPTQTERDKFLGDLNSAEMNLSRSAYANGRNSVSQTPSITGSGLQIASEIVDELSDELAHSLGPIAKKIVLNTLKRVSSQQQLIQVLGEKIPNEQERKQFLRKCQIRYRF